MNSDSTFIGGRNAFAQIWWPVSYNCPKECRSSLDVALQAGELSLQQAKSRARVGKGDRPAWNHWEFSVTYASLSNQLCVAGTYVRLLLEGADKVLCPLCFLTPESHLHCFAASC